MAFRDDREALRARKEQLEQALEEAKQKLARHEEKDVQDESELARLREQVARLRKAAKKEDVTGDASRLRARTWLWAVAGVGMVAVAMAVGVFVSLSSDSAPVAAIEMPSPGVPPARVERLTPAPTVAAPTPPIHLRFAALVVHAVGRADVPVGAGCVVDVAAVSDDVATLRVSCLETEVYDSRWDAGMSMIMSSSGVYVHPTSRGTTYRVAYSDVGQRSGPRPQIVLDTHRSALRIWSEGATPFELRFAVEDRGLASGPKSMPTNPEPRWRLAAELRSHAGTLPFEERDCELALQPEAAGRGLDCRASLRCGEVLVYGAGTAGLNDCTTNVQGAEAFPRAHDEGTTADDGDPIFELDVAARTVRVADSVGGAAWEAHFALRESPACALDGRWVGSVDAVEEGSVDGDGAALALVAERRAHRFEGAHEGEVAVELRCVHGEATLTAADGTRFDGHFGPGFASFLGEAEGETITLSRVAR